MIALRSQTRSHEYMRGFSLPVKSCFQMADFEEDRTGRDIIISVSMNDFLIVQLLIIGGIPNIAVSLSDSSTHAYNSTQILPMTWTDVAANGLSSTINAAIATYAAANSITVGLIEGQIPTLPAAPMSYQTIVSQTGTGAPAVSGSLAPTSTYAAGTTFTWARTGAGVYTLTASSAVFSTAGKTGVFVGGLNNLNAQYKYVVTSSTVITFTFAVQSLAVLGLLGFTATQTDGLLTQTMIYVQTYA